jgi:hypothetical protein
MRATPSSLAVSALRLSIGSRRGRAPSPAWPSVWTGELNGYDSVTGRREPGASLRREALALPTCRGRTI